MKRVRVLVTDDSLFMRAAIRKILAAEPRIELVGEARDGREAVTRVHELQPDVVTMDFNMPVLDGVGAVREIMARRPTPVVMLSAHTTEGARETFAALEAGAVDFLAKPSGEVSAELGRVGAQLVAKVLAAAEANFAALAPPAILALRSRISSTLQAVSPAQADSPTGGATNAQAPESGSATGATAWTRRITPPGGFGNAPPRIAVVAVSTGGPAALRRFLPLLPASLPVGILVVQHMPSGFTQALADRLASLCAVKVREAVDGESPGPGLVLVAPGDRHLDVHPDGTLRVTSGPEVNGVRPSADVTMRAAARTWGRRTIGIVMTGMGRDGAEGLQAIKRAGGVTLAQDKESSVVWGMPKSAIELGVVDHVVALDQLADALRRA